METMQTIIEKCKKAKLEKGYSYEYIADQSGIPKSTVERFFSDNGGSCRYDTVYPIAKFLVDFDESVVKVPQEKDMSLPPNEMIELYKDIIAKKEIENGILKEEHKNRVAEIRSDFKIHVDEIRQEYEHRLQVKQKTNIRLYIIIIILSSVIGITLIVDALVRGIGWFL